MQRDETSSCQKERLLLALLAGRTPDEAASEAGISRATAWRCRQAPKFQQRLNRARQELFRAGLDRLTSGLTEAVDTLRRNLSCGVPAAENAAAARMLEVALRYQDAMDLANRVAALEEQLAKQKQEEESWASKDG